MTASASFPRPATSAYAIAARNSRGRSAAVRAIRSDARRTAPVRRRPRARGTRQGDVRGHGFVGRISTRRAAAYSRIVSSIAKRPSTTRTRLLSSSVLEQSTSLADASAASIVPPRRRRRDVAKSALLAPAEQVVAPVDRRAQRALALGQVARHRRRGRAAGARGARASMSGRSTRVRAAASSIASGSPSSRAQISSTRRGRREKRLDRLRRARRRARPRRAAASGGTRVLVLAARGGAPPARREHLGPGAPASRSASGGGARATCSRLSSTSSTAPGGARSRDRLTARLRPPRAARARGDRGQQQTRSTTDARDRRRARRRANRLASCARGLEREPRLADAAGARQRHEPDAVAEQERRDARSSSSRPTSGVGGTGRARRRPCRRRRELRASCSEDRLLELLQLGARLEPELVDEQRRASRGRPRARPPGGPTR